MPSKWPSNPAMRTKLVLVLGLLLAAASAQALEFRSVKSHGAIMHEAPWASSKKLYVLSQGYPVEVIGSQPDWVRVRDAAGGVAWMSTASLSNQRTVVASCAAARTPRRPWLSQWIRTWCCRWSNRRKTAGSSCATPMAAVAMARFRRSGGCKQS